MEKLVAEATAALKADFERKIDEFKVEIAS